METNNRARSAGILMPISSLPSSYGIGTFGKAAYEFADWLKKAGQTYWQVLPIGPTGLGDSPYQSFSAFAGNPYFIDLDELIAEGLLANHEVNNIQWEITDNRVDYGLIYINRFNVLRMAYERSNHKNDLRYIEFCEKNSFWLEDYAMFMSLKEHFDNKSWTDWDEDIRFRKADAINQYKNLLGDRIDYWKFCQYKFYEQWNKLKAYVNNLGIRIIGDIPLYVALDSADVWANNHLFEMNEERRPTCVAGVPPDCFSEDGQLWGNPIYNWDKMEEDGFDWWKKRIANCVSLYDVIRIDHFIGIVRYYSVPADREDAKIGEFFKGPGIKLTKIIEEICDNTTIIAEDLGVIVPEVRQLMREMNWPGMKILEFAFEGNPANEYLPHNYSDSNSILYCGTHDNDTLKGYADKLADWQVDQIKNYVGVNNRDEIPRAMIRCGYGSIAVTAICQMQDILGLDSESRMNMPATVGRNWQWRMRRYELRDDDAMWLRRLAEVFGRLNC